MASASDGEFLVQAATYLGAAAIAVPVFNRFKLGSILGYLAAGVIVGPHVLGLTEMEEGVFHVAELGVVLFLFIIGLELSFSRLWSLRKNIFGLGATQMAVTSVAIAGVLIALGVMAPTAAVFAALSLAFSSTAFALQWMMDRGELNTGYGSRAFPVLLFQDLAVIPVLAALPFFVAGSGDTLGWIDAAKMVGVLGALVVIGRFLLNPAFKLVAGSGSREAFAATALFIVAATSLAVSWAGLSMALGSFLAGVLLAESAYRHQIETDIEPFRGLLLGLFFISMGMRLDLAAIADAWMVVVFGAIGLMALKSAILFMLTRLFGADADDSLKTAAVLSQGGEFAFVVLSLGVASSLFTNGQATVLSALVTVSMALTPAAVAIAARMASTPGVSGDGLEGPKEDEGHVIVAGFGRMGQIISQVLENSGVAITAIDKNPAHIQNAERFGFKVYYGDASRLDLLISAGALKAKAVIFCMDNPEAVNHAIAKLREACPTATILAVAHDRLHEIDMQPLGADFIVRETLESSLLIARHALEQFGHSDVMIDDIIQEFRLRDKERLLAQMDEGAEGGKHLLHQPFGSVTGARD
ncbi:MAG: monovalent cation:proton antiporter-2 (CPA2) family protein [Pseudomonadota bacterium]